MRQTDNAINQLERVCDLLFNHPLRDDNDGAAIDLIQESIAVTTNNNGG